MAHPARLAAVVLPLWFGAHAPAQPCDFSNADAATRAMLARFPLLDGAALLVGDRDGILHEAYFGDYTPSSVVPLASATKILSGVAIMTLIDDGRLDADAPVGTLLPEFAVPDAGLKSAMTVRQMFAHTAGLPGLEEDWPALSDPTITLAESAALVACCVPLEDTPGASFKYGGLSMQVAGRVAEVVSGQEWQSFLNTAVARPLGLTSIDFQGMGPTTNPRIGASARSTLSDYGKVLAMLLAGGEAEGPDGPVRVLSEDAVRSMIADQTIGLPWRSPPPAGTADYGYAFGVWVARTADAGDTIEYTSPGAYGSTPWIDLERGIYAMILVDGTRQLLRSDLDAIKAAIERTIDECPAPCPADLVGLPGSVNYFDMLAYLTRFNARNPSADLAEPFGTLNFFDLTAYLAFFNAGCP